MNRQSARQVLVVCPLAFEAAAARAALKSSGLANASKIVVSGPGPLAMSQRLAHALARSPERPPAAVLFGTCGSLHAGAESRGAAPEFHCIMNENGHRWTPTLASPAFSPNPASVISVPSPLLTPSEKQACFERHRADFVDCEAAAFAAACDATHLPWAVVRGVSDAWNDSLSPHVANWISASGTTRVMRVAFDLLRSPSLIPPTIALGKRSRIALRAAGKRLAAIVELAVNGTPSPANNPTA